MLGRITLVALVAYSAVSTDLYLSGIPAMVADLGVDHAAGQTTLSVFLIGLGLGQLVFGPLSDHFGRKPVVTAGIVFYVLASVLCALAPGIGALIGARGLQGLAAASGPVIARAMVRDRLAAREAARMMALLAATMAVVPLLAPVLGSWLLHWFDWRAQFVALALFGLLTLAGLRSVEETHPGPRGGDLRLFAAFAQLAVCARSPRFMAFALCGSSAFGAMFAYISSASYLVIEMLGVAPRNFGYTFMLAAGGYMSGSLLSSALVTRHGLLPLLRVGVCCALAGSLGLLALALSGAPTLATMLAGVFVCFAGAAFCIPNAQMGAIADFPHAAGGASAAFGFLQTGIGALAGFLVGRFYDGSLLPTATVMSGSALIAALCCAWLLRERARAGGVRQP